MSADTTPDDAPDALTVAGEVTVTDAYVDFNRSCSNLPELVVFVSDRIPQSSWEPVTGDPDDAMWLAENDAGLFRAWQTGLPVSEETGAATTTVEHAELGTVEDRYSSLHHVVTKEQNDREAESVASVRVQPGFQGFTTSITARVEFMQAVVDRYVNGPLGSDTVAYWYAARSSRGPYGWRRASSSKELWDGYVSPEVVLQRDNIYTWHPIRKQDADESAVYRG